MKWLIIQSAGKHDGINDTWTPNHYLRECFAVDNALQRLNQDVTIWGLRHPNFYDPPDFNSFDVVLTLENYKVEWLPTKNLMFKPIKIAWVIDLHVQGPWFYSKVFSDYDIILHSTKSLIPSLKELLPKARHLWFPNCSDDRYFQPIYGSKKTIDVLFVGKPRGMIERLKKDVGLVYHFATGRDMLLLISQAKIHFNLNIGVDVNYRTFETIGLGTCLVTNDSKELRELDFVDGNNCLSYSCYEEAVAKIKQSLETGSWEQIGKEGSKLSTHHTYFSRMCELLLIIKSFKRSENAV